MRHVVAPDFWAAYERLPERARRAVDKAFRFLATDEWHPSLRLKPLRPPEWSVRITRSYRAVGRREGDEVLWFWVGTHGQYDRLLK